MNEHTHTHMAQLLTNCQIQCKGRNSFILNVVQKKKKIHVHDSDIESETFYIDFFVVDIFIHMQ